MVKAPEKFVDEYFSRERRISSKRGVKPLKVRTRKISAEETKRLKKNAILLWDIYNTPEIKEILSEKEKLHFMDMESDTVHLCLSYVEKGILAEYEQDMGSRNDLAGAHIYKLSETLINRYFYNEKGIEESSKTKNTVRQELKKSWKKKESIKPIIKKLICQQKLKKI